jgi:phage-related protein
VTNVGSGEVSIFPTFQGFRSTVVSTVDGAVRTAGGVAASVLGAAFKTATAGLAIGITAAVGGATAIASKGLDRALNIQDAKAQLTGLGHDAASVSTIMESALASVKGTAFGLDQSASIAASAVASGIAPGEALTRVLKLTADSATIAKAPLSEMGSIITKVATNQRLTTETMQQFQDRGIPILQAVANQYGVTSDEAADMVSRGEVDFATFQNALEASVGGAALSSGTTARGAFANIGAAFSRMGAMFVQPAVDGAPSLFTSIANAVDRASGVLAPYAQQFSALLTPAMAQFGTYIDNIDFGAIVNGIREFYLGAVDVKDLLTTGFTENETLLPPEVVAGLQTAHNVFVGIGDAYKGVVAAFQTGDLSGPVNSIGTSFTTLKPALSDFVSQVPNIGGAVAELGAAALPVLTGALGFLADNVDTIIQFMPLIVAGFVAWRLASSAAAGASIALRAAEVAALPGQIARNGLRLAAAGIEYRVAAATRASTVAEATATGARNGGMLATVRQTAVLVAQRTATIAASIATKAAAAAQWLMNAALTANPIGLIIAAIVALVAGLIWFFTQTELGQDIWENFTRFLGEAWTNIVNFVTDAINNVVAVITRVVEIFVIAWQNYWNLIGAVVGAIWGFIVAVVTNYINTVVAIITAIVSFIVTVWTTYWDIVFTVISTVWNAIVGFVTFAINLVVGIITTVINNIVTIWQLYWAIVFGVIETVWNAIMAAIGAAVAFVQAIITGVITGIQAVWNAVWQAIADFFTNIWNAMVGFITGVVTTIQTVIGGVIEGVRSTIQGVFDFVAGIPDTILATLGNLGELLVNSGRDLIQGFIDGITGMLDGVGDAVGGVMDFIGGFFPNSPAKRGQFSGSGWTRVKRGGAAVIDQFAAGFGNGDDPFGGFPFPQPPGGGGGSGSGGSGTDGAGLPGGFTQINHFAEMDPEIAIDAAGQRAASIARRAGV